MYNVSCVMRTLCISVRHTDNGEDILHAVTVYHRMLSYLDRIVYGVLYPMILEGDFYES